MRAYCAAGAVSNSYRAREAVREVRAFAARAREGSNDEALGDVRAVAAVADTRQPAAYKKDALRDVRAVAAVDPRADKSEALAGVRVFAATKDANDHDKGPALRSFAATTNVDNAGNLRHRQVADVDAYASAGFLQGGVELAAVAESAPTGYPHVLISFAYDKDHSFFETKLGYDATDWMGDSGAHTVWTKGVTIDLAGYIDWCHYYRAMKPNFVSISLDVIPGGPGRPPTKKQGEKAMAESLENGDAMRAAGLPIMEVFHQGEPWAFLDTLLDRRQPGEVFGISKRGKLAPKHQIAWLDQVFARLRDRYGWANLPPCHGLGLAATSRHASRYPWWSVDASSWVASAMYGREVLPDGKKRDADKRNSNRELRKLYLMRTLNAWLTREEMLTRLWQERGVRFSDTPDDVLLEAT